MNKFKIIVSSIVLGFMLFTMSCNNMLSSTSVEDYSSNQISRAVTSGRGEGVVESAGRLQVNGNLVTSETGEKISLIGMSMFWSNWAGDYYNADTVDYLVDNFEISIIRAAYGVPHDPDEHPDGDYSKIERVVERAIDRGIYVIIDWHTEGDAYSYHQEARDFFNHFSSKYGSYPNVIYELWNEPINSGVDSLRNWNQEMANIIRNNDPDNLVICGSDTWSQNPQSYTINDPNAAYTFHGYFDDPANGAVHRSQFYKNVDAAMNQGSAVFVTEFGAHYGTTGGSSEIMDACIERGISMAAWSVNHKVEPWSIFDSFMGNLTAIGNFYKQRMSTWPPINVVEGEWSKRVQDTGSVSLTEEENGDFVANVTNTGSYPWSVQVSQDGVLLEQGKTYTISFSAKADTPRSINLAVGHDLTEDPYYVSFYDPDPIVLTNSFQNYSVTFTMNDATYADTKLAFDMGNISGSNVTTNVYVNNFSIVEGGAVLTANAGADVSISNPISEVTLDGSNSFDPDGTIVSYQWVGNGFSSDSAIAVVSGLLVTQTTSYTYTLTVTDNEGNTASDTVEVTVNPENTTQVAAIRSNINGSYVCAENGGADALLADRSAIGGWEQFEIIPQSDGTVAIKSLANNMYVACELDNGNILKARSSLVDNWEKFILEDLGNGSVAIKAVAIGKYVVNEMYEGNILKARSDNPDTWESFTIEYQ